ncbi:MAG: hypothetical protein AAGI30_12610 [Planctomycetota bacterium]
MKELGIAALIGCALATASFAQGIVIGLVDFDGTELRLDDYTNNIWTPDTISGFGLGTSAAANAQGTNASTLHGSGDIFAPASREFVGANDFPLPDGQSDDSVSAAAGGDLFTGDELGIATDAFGNNGYFAVTDLINTSSAPQTGVAEFVFDIDDFELLALSVDVAAMGDFEDANDSFTFAISFDGITYTDVITSDIDEDGSFIYEHLDTNSPVDLPDPLVLNGEVVDGSFAQQIRVDLAGTGEQLYVRFTANADGGSEAFGFDNLTIFAVPGPGAWSLVFALPIVAGRRRTRL